MSLQGCGSPPQFRARGGRGRAHRGHTGACSACNRAHGGGEPREGRGGFASGWHFLTTHTSWVRRMPRRSPGGRPREGGACGWVGSAESVLLGTASQPRKGDVAGCQFGALGAYPAVLAVAPISLGGGGTQPTAGCTRNNQEAVRPEHEAGASQPLPAYAHCIGFGRT
jgi:hypothetical protein